MVKVSGLGRLRVVEVGGDQTPEAEGRGCNTLQRLSDGHRNGGCGCREARFDRRFDRGQGRFDRRQGRGGSGRRRRGGRLTVGLTISLTISLTIDLTIG